MFASALMIRVKKNGQPKKRLQCARRRGYKSGTIVGESELKEKDMIAFNI